MDCGHRPDVVGDVLRVRVFVHGGSLHCGETIMNLKFYYLYQNKNYIDCEVEYERSTGDGWDEPFIPETYALIRAELKGVDITPLLSDDAVESIEIEASKHFKNLEDEYDE